MANTGTMTTKMAGLWESPAFQGLFVDWPLLRQRLDSEKIIQTAIMPTAMRDVIVKYLPTETVKLMYRPEFLNHPEDFGAVYVVLRLDEPDAVTTVADYTTDEQLNHLVLALFPTNRVETTWFIDGLGDQGRTIHENGKLVFRQAENVFNDDTDEETPDEGNFVLISVCNRELADNIRLFPSRAEALEAMYQELKAVSKCPDELPDAYTEFTTDEGDISGIGCLETDAAWFNDYSHNLNYDWWIRQI